MKSKLETILIVDYGSQYTQLIARRIRELEVFCLVYPFNKITKKILNEIKPSGLHLFLNIILRLAGTKKVAFDKGRAGGPAVR